jgi:hypothetical protein
MDPEVDAARAFPRAAPNGHFWFKSDSGKQPKDAFKSLVTLYAPQERRTKR